MSTSPSSTGALDPTGSPEVDACLRGLTHPDHDVRQRAALAAGTLGDPAAAPGVVTRLRDEPDDFVRESLTWATTRMPEAARPLVEELVRSADPVVRLRAFHALGKIGSSQSVPVLAEHTGDRDPRVAAKARSSLARIGDPASVGLLTRHLAQGSDAEQGQLTLDLASYGEAAVPELVRVLADDSPVRRRHAADVLGHLGEPAAAAAPALVGLLADEDDDVRIAAGTALFELGPVGVRRWRPTTGRTLAWRCSPDGRLRRATP